MNALAYHLAQKLAQKIKTHAKSIIIALIVLCGVGAVLFYAQKSDFSLEETIIEIWDTYVEKWGYVILFFWSVLEGELGLIFAGIAAHTGHLNVFLAIFVAGLGGFAGDQIYFYIGRFNKDYIQNRLISQRRKLALAHLLLQKYGWSIIFIQRYMYGMRTIIPISIGITRYNAFKFAIINLLSAWVWAAITITLAWLLGEQILDILQTFKSHPYIFIVLAGVLLGGVLWFFNSRTRKIDKHINKLQQQLDNTQNKQNTTSQNLKKEQK
ncbi:DedA family protein [Helicobacter sp. T3_23-1059]